MEKYNRRMGGYEAQGNIEIRRNGCDQQTHRFYLTGCEEAEIDQCAQAYRVVFRTEACDGRFYEFVGYVREVQVNTCAAQENAAQHHRCGACEQDACAARTDRIADHHTGAWNACGEQNCGCGHQGGNAFTYESIRAESKGTTLWDNWLRRGH